MMKYKFLNLFAIFFILMLQSCSDFMLQSFFNVLVASVFMYAIGFAYVFIMRLIKKGSKGSEEKNPATLTEDDIKKEITTCFNDKDLIEDEKIEKLKEYKTKIKGKKYKNLDDAAINNLLNVINQTIERIQEIKINKLVSGDYNN